MFRLHIDIPLNDDEQDAADVSEHVAEFLKELLQVEDITKVQYRLANDDDRTVRNYLIKDDEGHVATKKCVIE